MSESKMVLDYNGQLILHIEQVDLNRFVNSGFFKIKLKPKVEKIEENTITFRPDLVYLDYRKIGDLISSRKDQFGYSYSETTRLSDYIESRNLHIKERSKFGIELKTDPTNQFERYSIYKQTVDEAMERKLRDKQMRDSFFMFAMTKSGNFSVPGSGKTASALGVYAFLKKNDLVDRIVMIGPKNAFGSWIDEFQNCFGKKEALLYYNLHDPKFKTSDARRHALQFDSGNCNLFLFNYESLYSYEEDVIKIVSNRTLLVFDEVHRVKRVDGKYARSALAVAKHANYIIAMTGTPIPNSYKDIYNFLHILYDDEYNEFFGFDVGYLNDPTETEMEIINQKIQPFFCRTSKRELQVPEANEDILVDVYASQKEQLLFDVIRKKYRQNHLVLFIRLLQLESNPELLLEKLDVSEFAKILDIDLDVDEIDYVDYSEDVVEAIRSIPITTKKMSCIEATKKLVEKGKPVIIWCYFKDSIKSIQSLLAMVGITAKVIYGEVELEDRIKLIEDFKKGQFQVLITNPHTLAESVSLHSICHDAIYFEYSYNLVHLLQSKDRIHRLGLPDGQYTQYYFMKNIYQLAGDYSFDLKIYNRLKEKEQIMLDAIDNQILEKVYTSEEDLKAIFGDLF